MFSWVVSVIERLGYLGVFFLTFLENLAPPIPSEVVIPLAGYVAAREQSGLVLMIAVASAGSLLGAVLWYWIGRKIGEKRLRHWVDRHGKWVTLDREDIDQAQDWFRRHGGLSVFLGRLVPGVRTFISVPAGLAGMPVIPFLLYSAAGTVVWTAALAMAGVLLQANFSRIKDYMDPVSNVLTGVFVAVLIWRYIKQWRKPRTKATPAHSS